MAETIFRYIDGVLRPLTVGKVNAGKQSVSTVNQRRKIPKHTLVAGHYRTPHAFTIPNVTCQVCGAKVFYYEHPSGARVLFDHLGPPWPKHPCYEAMQKGKSRKPQISPTRMDWTPWRKALWSPVIVQNYTLSEDGKSVKVMATGDTHRVFFELPRSLLRSRGLAVEAIQGLLIQVQETSSTTFNVQLHDGNSSWGVNGCRSESDLVRCAGSQPSSTPQLLAQSRKPVATSNPSYLSNKTYKKSTLVKQFEYRWDDQGCVVTLYENSIFSVIKITGHDAMACCNLRVEWTPRLGRITQAGSRWLYMVDPVTYRYFGVLLDAQTMRPKGHQDEKIVKVTAVEDNAPEPVVSHASFTPTVTEQKDNKQSEMAVGNSTISSIDFIEDNFIVLSFLENDNTLRFALHRASKQSHLILTALLQQDKAPQFVLKPIHRQKRLYEVYLGASMLGCMKAMPTSADRLDIKHVTYGVERNSRFL